MFNFTRTVDQTDPYAGVPKSALVSAFWLGAFGIIVQTLVWAVLILLCWNWFGPALGLRPIGYAAAVGAYILRLVLLPSPWTPSSGDPMRDMTRGLGKLVTNFVLYLALALLARLFF